MPDVRPMSPGALTDDVRRRGGLRRTGVGQRPRHHRLDLGNVEGLADVVECAGAYRFDRRLERTETADEEHLAVGILGLERPQQVEAGLRRVEVDVRDHEIDALLPQQAQRARRILLGDNPAIVGGNELGDETTGLAIVVDDQDGVHRIDQARVGAAAARRVRAPRQLDGEYRSPTRLVRGVDLASVGAHHFADDAEAQARPVSDRLRRDPRLEEVRQQIGGDAGASVSHFQANAPLGARAADAERAAVGHGVQRVGDEVQQGELELRRVRVDVGQRFIQLNLHLDTGAGQARDAQWHTPAR